MKPKNFKVYVNPKIVTITNIHEFAWEECCSLIGMRSQIKRPIGIQLSYADEHGEYFEDSFFDFQARMIQHEMDHLKGMSLINFKSKEQKQGGIVQFDDREDNLEPYHPKSQPPARIFEKGEDEVFNNPKVMDNPFQVIN